VPQPHVATTADALSSSMKVSRLAAMLLTCESYNSAMHVSVWSRCFVAYSVLRCGLTQLMVTLEIHLITAEDLGRTVG
jgi:hypothetical protein